MPQTASAKGSILHPLRLALPGLPAELAGLRILHLTDLHVRKPLPLHDRLLAELAVAPHDLLAFTGDLIEGPGHEKAGLRFMERLLQTCRPRLGAFGVFGNHDTPDLRRELAGLPMRWLVDDAWNAPDLPLSIFGIDCLHKRFREPSGDLLAALLNIPHSPDQPRFRLGLAHVPSWLVPAGDAGVDLLLSGHTHGGQCRLPNHKPLVNATRGWPLGLTSGILQARRTIGIVSRGVGESDMAGLRFFCPPQVVLAELAIADKPLADQPRPICLQAW